MVYFFSIAAAVLFSLAAFIQHREAQLAPKSTSLKLSIISKLMKRPIWILGVALDVLAYLAQFIALKSGSLLLVQPILAFGLTSTLLLEALWGRLKTSYSLVGLSLVSAILLAIFLISTKVSAAVVLPGVGIGLIVTLIALLGFIIIRLGYQRVSPTIGGLSIGFAVGILHGIATFVTKVAANAISAHGYSYLLVSWPLYSLAIVAILDLIMTQSAFQSAQLSVTMPLINIFEPTTAMILGAILLRESLYSKYGSLFLALLFILMAVVSLVLSTRATKIVDGE